MAFNNPLAPSASVPNIVNMNSAVQANEQDLNMRYHSSHARPEQIQSKPQTQTSFSEPVLDYAAGHEDDPDSNVIADEKLPLNHIKNMANTIKHASQYPI